MIRPRLSVFTFGFAGLLLFDGCSSPPMAMDASHPASVNAPESFTAPARSSLRADASTRRTRELLAQREQQAMDAESEAPADQTSSSIPNSPRQAPGPMKGMDGHEHH